jgi:hypothetical protein
MGAEVLLRSVTSQEHTKQACTEGQPDGRGQSWFLHHEGAECEADRAPSEGKWTESYVYISLLFASPPLVMPIPSTMSQLNISVWPS